MEKRFHTQVYRKRQIAYLNAQEMEWIHAPN